MKAERSPNPDRPTPAVTAADAGPDGKTVQRMFGEIAPRYDLLNHLLSASIDRRWRKRAVAKVADHLGAGVAHSLCLDLCAGTGDLAMDLCRRLPLRVIASDFCHPMLQRCAAKARASDLDRVIRAVEADALTLPFASDSFDAVTIAFGLRNLEDRSLGLAEMRRVLKDGGLLLILEFSRPSIPVFRQGFQFYFHHILPRLGAIVSGQPAAYRYLPDSVRNFPPQQELAAIIAAAGFTDVGYRNLSGGIAALHWGVKG